MSEIIEKSIKTAESIENWPRLHQVMEFTSIVNEKLETFGINTRFEAEFTDSNKLTIRSPDGNKEIIFQSNGPKDDTGLYISTKRFDEKSLSSRVEQLAQKVRKRISPRANFNELSDIKALGMLSTFMKKASTPHHQAALKDAIEMGLGSVTVKNGLFGGRIVPPAHRNK